MRYFLPRRLNLDLYCFVYNRFYILLKKAFYSLDLMHISLYEHKLKMIINTKLNVLFICIGWGKNHMCAVHTSLIKKLIYFVMDHIIPISYQDQLCSTTVVLKFLLDFGNNYDLQVHHLYDLQAREYVYVGIGDSSFDKVFLR